MYGTYSSSAPAPHHHAAHDGEGVRIQQTWHMLLRHRWLIAGVTLLTIALGALVTSRQPRVYESAATVRIDDRNGSRDVLGTLSPVAMQQGKAIETEMVVLRSRTLAEQVVDSLGLRVVVEGDAASAVQLTALSLPRESPDGRFEMERGPSGTYTLTRVGDQGPAVRPLRVAERVPFTVAGATLRLDRAGAGALPAKFRFSIVPFRTAVAALQGTLVVTRPEPRAQVVALGYSSTSPRQAAAVPNAVVDAFLAYKRQDSKLESRSAVEFLRRQVAAYEEQLRGAENQLRSFREAQHVVNPQEQATEQVKRLTEQQASRDALRSERQALSQLLERVDRDGSSAAYRQLSAFPVFFSNQAVQNILQALTEQETERARASVRRTDEDENIQSYNQRIRELETQLYQLARNYLSSLDSQLASLDANLARFDTELEQIPAREVEYARLSRETALLGDIYGQLQQRLKESELKEAVEPGDARPLDRAIEPLYPVSPRPVRNIALSVILGLALGLGAAMLWQAMDNRVRTHEDVQLATHGMPVLASIPRIRPAAGAAKANGNGNGKRGVVPVPAESFLAGNLVTSLDPRNPASEAYRSLRTNITFASVEHATQVLVITSAMPGDGKSTSAANLAITLAQQGVRTLLVDADMRKGLLHRVFGVPQEPGLSHVLLGRTPVEEAIRAGVAGTELDFLPSGVFPPNPAELLGSARLRKLLDELRQRYEMVVFDAPPLNLVTDAAVLGKVADSTLLVTRAGVTDKRALQHAAAQLQQLRLPVTGVVLNSVNPDEPGYGYGYGYGYSYGGAAESYAGAGSPSGNGKH